MIVAGYNEEDLRFLSTAVGNRLLAPEQLDSCLDLLKESRREGISLAELLESRGVLSRDQVRSVQDSRAANRAGGPVVLGYEPARLLGHGPLGTVWSARSLADDREVAIKTFRPTLAGNRAFACELVRRVRRLSGFAHSGLVSPVEVVHQGPALHLVSVLARGEPLSAVLERQGRLAAPEAARVVRDAARALAASGGLGLHHGDLSPGNVFVAPGGRVAVLDLAVPKPLEVLALSPYISPEQAGGLEEADARTEVYALGLVLYRALTGRVPFEGPVPAVVLARHIGERAAPARDLVAGLTAEMDRLLEAALAKRPAERPRDPGEMARALEGVLGAMGAAPDLEAPAQAAAGLPEAPGAEVPNQAGLSRRDLLAARFVHEQRLAAAGPIHGALRDRRASAPVDGAEASGLAVHLVRRGVVDRTAFNEAVARGLAAPRCARCGAALAALEATAGEDAAGVCPECGSEVLVPAALPSDLAVEAPPAEQPAARRDETLARLAVERGLVDEEALARARSGQATEGAALPLGQVLVRQRLISAQAFVDLNRAVDLALGEVAVPGPPPVRRFGPYEVLGEVARGGMGIVYRARDPSLRRTVALKVLRDGAGADASQVERFLREARSASRLAHPYIVQVFDVGEVEQTHYFTMEFVEGESLDAVLAGGERRLDELLVVILKVAMAMHYAHEQGVVHRDLKPQNIIVDRQGNPKITDFGLAKTVDTETLLTKSGTALGTPFYMPPEQALGDLERIDARSDVYALGVILYEVIAGKLPYTGATTVEIYHRICHDDPIAPRRINSRIHRDLETICLRAMEKVPDARYRNALELAEDLESYLKGEPIRARPVSLLGLALRRLRRHRRVAALVAFLVLAGVAGMVAAVRWQAAAIALQRQTQAEAALGDAREMAASGDAAGAARRAEEVAVRFAGLPAAYEARVLAGRILRGVREHAQAAEGFARAFLEAPDDAGEAVALAELGETFRLTERFDEAEDALGRARARASSSPAALDVDLARARLRLATGRLGEARALFAGVAAAGGASETARLEAAREAAWLATMLPERRVEGSFVAPRLVDLDGDGRPELVHGEGAAVVVRSLGPGGEAPELGRLELPRGAFPAEEVAGFRPSVLAIGVGDLDGDGRPEVVAAWSPASRFAAWRTLSWKDGQLVDRGGGENGVTTVRDVLLADVDGDGQAEVVFAHGHPWVASFVLDRDPASGEEVRVPFCPDLIQVGTSVTESLTAGDLDGDGRLEVAVGTSEHASYEVRVVRHDGQGRYPTVWNRKLGAVRQVLLTDVDGDGTAEVLAAKSYAFSPVLGGNADPYGPREGLYAFRYLEGTYQQVWAHTLPPGDRRVRHDVLRLAAGDVGGVYQIASCWTRRGAAGEGAAWLEVLERGPDGRFTARRVHGDNPPTGGLLVGDLDGDGEGELLVFDREGMRVLGW
ncbi:MAG: protein kinase [Planctomycetes bacterium]|nr:protein kinase [Planctomycetota bacterium]